jgi:signal transduction histidine kinase
VLHEEILPSLLIREFVFLYSERGVLKLVSLMGVTEERVPKDQDVPDLQTQLGRYRSMDVGDPQIYDWIRLMLPLRFGNQIIGFWLFGRRDPDDLYAQAEIQILQSLANQTAVALSNIMQTQQLKSIYEANILRHEQERLRLAHELHDSVLNEMARLVVSDDAPILSPKLQEVYEGVTQRVREIVSDLRPPMLKFGLKLAFEGLADHLMERNHDAVQIIAQIQMNSDCRYTEAVEINLYRIVQEACENSLRYAHANAIQITGTLAPASIEIAVLDDGIGFVTETNLKLDEMVANKHFGLANMLERASLINAVINIESKPQQGTQIKVQWKAK